MKRRRGRAGCAGEKNGGERKGKNERERERIDVQERKGREKKEKREREIVSGTLV
jgi:hypothetical protein